MLLYKYDMDEEMIIIQIRNNCYVDYFIMVDHIILFELILVVIIFLISF
jgi:hypothetical protein